MTISMTPNNSHSPATTNTIVTTIDPDNLNESDKDEEIDNKDEEGLLGRYDVVVCGTSLVASILASALARAGQTVLQCDGNDLYGELDAGWTLSYLNEQQNEQRQKNIETQMSSNQYDHDHQTKTNTQHNLSLSPRGSMQSLEFHSITQKCNVESQSIRCGTHVVTPYGYGVVQQDWNSTAQSLVVSLLSADAESSIAKLYVGRPDSCPSESLAEYLNQHCHITAAEVVEARHILQQNNRSFALDISPTLLYTVGPAVNTLLVSQVADYVEFKSLEGLLLYNNKSDIPFQKVPCSKKDVFASTDLSPMEKRRLMKFLQLAHDFAEAQVKSDNYDAEHGLATVTAAAAVQSLNERHLNQGRSLPRPQNKSVLTAELQELQDCMQDNFVDYLVTKQKLSPKLIQFVRYALALDWKVTSASDTTTTTVRQGLEAICQHMQSLGRFGGTAFLVPLYGSGELPQAFCRSAAVFGATQLLRRAVCEICTVDNNYDNCEIPVATSDSNESKHNTSRTVHNVLLQVDQEVGSEDSTNEKLSTKSIFCTHVIVPEEAFVRSNNNNQTSSTPLLRVLRRISILRGKPLLEKDSNTISGKNSQCHVIIFPPNLIGEHCHDTIFCLLVDESVHVAPYPTQAVAANNITGGSGACTVLHVTTTRALSADVEQDEKLFELVVQTIAGTVASEIFQSTFSYLIHDDTRDDTLSEQSNIQGLYVIRRGQPGIACDAAFETARRIFAQICPDQPFGALAKSIEQIIQERKVDASSSGKKNDLDYDDPDEYILQSALGMIQEKENELSNSHSVGL